MTFAQWRKRLQEAAQLARQGFRVIVKPDGETVVYLDTDKQRDSLDGVNVG